MSEDNLEEKSVLSDHNMSWESTSVTRLGGWCPYLLSHLTGPHRYIFFLKLKLLSCEREHIGKVPSKVCSKLNSQVALIQGKGSVASVQKACGSSAGSLFSGLL